MGVGGEEISCIKDHVVSKVLDMTQSTNPQTGYIKKISVVALLTVINPAGPFFTLAKPTTYSMHSKDGTQAHLKCC